MAIGDIFRLSVVGTGPDNQELVNVFHYRQELALVFDQPGEDLVEAWRADVETIFSGCFGGGCAIRQYSVRGVTDPTYGFDDVLVEPVGGGLGGDQLPPQSAAVITWRTGLIGRSYRGRTYTWPATETHQNNGRISTGLRDNLQALAGAAVNIGDALTTAEWQLGILSTYHNRVKRATPLFTPVVDGVVRDYVYTQRRRHARVGA